MTEGCRNNLGAVIVVRIDEGHLSSLRHVNRKRAGPSDHLFGEEVASLYDEEPGPGPARLDWGSLHGQQAGAAHIGVHIALAAEAHFVTLKLDAS